MDIAYSKSGSGPNSMGRMLISKLAKSKRANARFVELELDNSKSSGRVNSRGEKGPSLNATDQSVQPMGLDALYSSDFEEGMIDEVPVFEMDGSSYDPTAFKNVSRLAHPVLLIGVRHGHLPKVWIPPPWAAGLSCLLRT